MRSDFSGTIKTKSPEELIKLFSQSHGNICTHSWTVPNIHEKDIKLKSMRLNVTNAGVISCEIEGIATKKGLRLLNEYCGK